MGTLFTTILLFVLGVGAASAQTSMASCTTSSLYRDSAAYTYGIPSALLNVVVDVLTGISEAFYTEIINDPLYSGTLWAAVALFIVIYGFRLINGAERLVPGKVFMNFAKLGLVLALVSPGGGWTWFNTLVTPLFWGSMVELIDLFSSVSVSVVGGQSAKTMVASASEMQTTFQNIAEPISIMDRPTALLLSSHFMVTVVGVIWTGPYGFFMGVLLIWGAVCFLRALAEAFYSYLKSIVGLWFMFSVAPIFLVCMLFNKSQTVFRGWINVIVGTSLQITFLFTFLGFYILIISMSLQNFLQIQWCYAEKEGLLSGIPLKINGWVPYMVQDSTGQLIPLGNGPWGFFGFMNNPNIQFPIDLIDVLFFLLCSYVAWQYSRYVPQFSQAFANSGFQLADAAAKASEFFRMRGWAPDQIAVKSFRRFIFGALR